MPRAIPLPACAVLLGVLVAAAPAYQVQMVGGVPRKWPTGEATIFTDAVMTPGQAQAIRNAADTWSQVDGAAFRFVYGGNSPSADVRNHANGNSDLYFDPNLPPFGYAVTYGFETGADIVERDVAFNGALTWSTDPTSGGLPDVETVALHELGHVLGLMHESAKPAVMKPGGDPSNLQRTLLEDDRDGVRFLYPAGGGGGGGGGPKGPDVSAGTLQVAQGTPGAGNGLTLRVEVRNRSSIPAGPFRVAAVLVAALPAKATDEELGSTDVASLAGGSSTTVDIDTFVPASTPPGSWRLGAFVDPPDDLLDPVRENNGAAAAPFTVRVPPAALLLGDAMDLGLGPLGTDGGAAWVGAGTEVTLRAKGKRGVRPVLRVLDGPGGPELAEAEGRAGATLRWTAPEDAVYSFEVANSEATVGRVRVETSGRTRLRNAAFVAPEQVPFAAYDGGIVRILATYAGEAAPLLCRPPTGPDLFAPGVAKGSKARLGPLFATESGPHEAVLQGEGEVRLTLDSRTPSPGGLFVR